MIHADRYALLAVALAWLVCFRRALIAGALVGLVVSLLASVLSAESTKAVRSSSALATGTEVRAGSGEVVVGSAVRATGNAAAFGFGASADAGAVPVSEQRTPLKTQTDVTAASTTTRGRGTSLDDAATRGTPPAGASPSRTIPSSAPRALPVPRSLRVYGHDPLTVETSRDPATLVTLAAMEFGVDPAWMLRVARCESGPSLDVNAIGDSGTSLGLWQFQARTFVGYARISGLGYTLADLTNPEAQSRLAAWAFANGRSSAWSCAR